MTAYSPCDVLVIADDDATSDRFVMALRALGLSTDVAGTVVEAKRLLSRGDYCVVILDLELSDDTAFDILSFMREEKLTEPHLVVLTASDASRVARLDTALVKTVVVKPVDVHDFASQIHVLTQDRSRRAVN